MWQQGGGHGRNQLKGRTPAQVPSHDYQVTKLVHAQAVAVALRIKLRNVSLVAVVDVLTKLPVVRGRSIRTMNGCPLLEGG